MTSRPPRQRNRRFTRSVLTLAILVAFSAPVGAADTIWIGNTGSWSNPSSWDNGVPGLGDNAILNQAGGHTASFDNFANPMLGSVLVEGGMTLEHLPGLTLTTDSLGLGVTAFGQQGYYQVGGSLHVTNATVLGGFGEGNLMLQPGGFHTTGSLMLGDQEDSLGVYTLLGLGLSATLQVDGDAVVGNQGDGDVLQLGGTHNVGNDLILSAGATSGSTYQLVGIAGLDGFLNVTGRTVVGDQGDATFVSQAGSHTSGELIVGRAGIGEYQQTGGTTTVTSRFVVAELEGSIGNYSLYGGVLNDPAALVGATIGDAGEGVFLNQGGTHNVFGNLVIGNQNTAGGSGVYQLVDDTVNGLSASLNVSGSSIIGNEGSGEFQHMSGLHDIQGDLVLASVVGSSGSYLMEDGTLSVTGSEIVGNEGNASFSQLAGTHGIGGDLIVARFGDAEYTQEGGTISVTGRTVVGEQAGSHGAVSLHNGLLESQSGAVVGDAGYGAFTTGGEHRVTGDLVLGNQGGATGTYHIGELGSLIVSGDTIVGLAGRGDFTQAVGGGGYHETGNLFLGGDPGGNFETSGHGTYTMTAGGELVVHNWTSVGQDGVGVFDNNGGSHTGNFLLLGNAGSSVVNSSGTYNLSGNGTVTMNNTTVGGFGYGEFNQSGGVHSVSNNLIVGDGPAIGGTPTRQGVYNLSGGELAVGGDSIIGRGNDSFAGEPGGLGSFTQTGGLHEVAGDLILGQSGSEGNGTGTYNLTGTGQLNVTGGSIIGQGGTGTFNQYAGVHNTGALILGADAGGMGTYNLHGGTLNDGAIVGDAGTGVFNNTGNNFGSTHNVTGDLVLGNQATGHGTYNLSGDTSGPNAAILDVSGNTVVGGAGTGVFNQTGGKHSAAGVQVGAAGTYNFSGGELTLDGGTGTLTNAGQVNLSGAGTRTVDGNVVNNGTFKITDTTANFTGTFTNNGAYISDPSDNHFVDLVIGASGYLVGGAGDNWHITGDFENHSEENLLWNTVDAYLGFTGTGPQEFLLAGMDFGLDAAGWNNNFAWGSLFLGSGSTLSLGDGNLGNASTALYVDALLLEGNDLGLLANIFGNGFNIYYDVNDSRNAYLAGGDYTLGGGGRLIAYGGATPPPPAVPEPATLALLALGLLGLGYSRRRR